MSKAAANLNRRGAPRKEVEPLRVSNIASLDNLARLARYAEIVEASANGLLIHVRREDLIPQALKSQLTLDSLIGDRIFIHLEDMNLEISGHIRRTKLLGKKGYLVAMDYTDDAPEYWRECLMDLLPTPGELEKEDKF